MTKFSGTPDQYNVMFKNGGFSGLYDLPSNRSWYYPLYKKVVSELRKINVKNILEVGCGTGSFAELALKNGYSYKGFDFSEVAIKKASIRTGRTELFYQGDALDTTSYETKYDYDCIICTEVLEHIEKDIDAISHWQKGTYVICSVPNFDAPGQHVRYFENSRQVLDRYSPEINIEKIFKLKKPVLPDISLKNYLRHIVWYRYEFKKLSELLGFGSFEDVGGWFVFAGRKR